MNRIDNKLNEDACWDPKGTFRKTGSHGNIHDCIPCEMALDFGCLGWARTADLLVLRDDEVIECAEPGKKINQSFHFINSQ